MQGAADTSALVAGGHRGTTPFLWDACLEPAFLQKAAVSSGPCLFELYKASHISSFAGNKLKPVLHIPLVLEYEEVSIPPNGTDYKINSYNDTASAVGSGRYQFQFCRLIACFFRLERPI